MRLLYRVAVRKWNPSQKLSEACRIRSLALQDVVSVWFRVGKIEGPRAFWRRVRAQRLDRHHVSRSV